MPPSYAELFDRLDAAAVAGQSELDLSGLGLDFLPRTITQLQELKILHLDENQLRNIPDFLGEMESLEILTFRGNRLSEVSPALGKLHRLIHLDLAGNALRTLPASISNLKQLVILDAAGNRLSAFPRVIRPLHSLRYLNLSTNRISRIPEWIGELSSLTTFYFANNAAASVPRTLGHLKEMLDLDLSGCPLREFPRVVRRLRGLERLRLASAQISEMPAWLQELQRLTRLELQFNSITAVADSIGELRSLTYLDLDSNKLQMLPNSIGRLASMAHLDLTNCDLRDLPESLRGMERLETLYLQGNPALSIPHEVLGPGWRDRGVGTPQANPKDILNYYWRIKSAERPLNEAKLILVGRGGVGKTSLVNQLIHNQFNPGEEKTEGINITEWPIRLNGAEDVRLHIWDFGGQEIMHATHQFFLTQRSIYLLVLNGRGGGEDSDAEYWLKLIESFGGESPVIVVLNKIEEHQFDLNRRALELKYPVRAFVETDCRSGNGIDDLWNVIARETDRLEHLRDAFPGSWFTIKNKLAGMRRNYVTFDQFRELCRENGEADQLSQESLAGYLHTLGIVLNYKDDPRLQDTHVLNPHWVTNGIYKIINSELLARNKGEIRLSDLGGILDVEEYPPPTRRFILDLMKKFDLCFTFPDDDAHYLIPELLDKQEPTDTAEFGSQPCLNFQYAYPILPEGLLPRFIVRTHTLSEGLPRWRSGVILSFEGNRALVKADLQERMVNISVLGPTPGRRRLLAVIRSDFERIHNDIRNLHPREMIPLPGHPETALNYRELTIFEQQGVRSFPKVVQNQILMVDVNAMLNGVDLAGTRERRKLMSSSSGAVRIFYSYSHRDESLRNELENHLKLLQRQGVIEAWSDRNIEAGEDWKVRIDDALERAHLILLLVSSDFLASDYCYELEMRRALERHAAGEARVVPIILRDVSWASAPFAHLQALPRDGLPVMKWQDRDTAWRNVTEGLERVVGSLRK